MPCNLVINGVIGPLKMAEHKWVTEVKPYYTVLIGVFHPLIPRRGPRCRIQPESCLSMMILRKGMGKHTLCNTLTVANGESN